MNERFSQRKQRLLRLKILREGRAASVQRANAPAVFEQCSACGEAVTKAQWDKALYVCPHCGHHRPISAYMRLSMLLDPGTFRELDDRLTARNALDFPGYDEKLAVQRAGTALAEAVVAAKGRVCGMPLVAVVMDSRFMMGSMGVAVGEKVARAADAARKSRVPLVIFCASGGARMQEGILSLMQMAKTAAAITRFQDAGGLYIAWLTHPTTGGVTASFASLGDITVAEPGALIAFAGPRVIEQTIKQKLPEGFQRAEYLEEHGFVDAVVPRAEMKDTLCRILRLHSKGGAL